MFKTTKKVLCYTAITGILNLSFQPTYAGKSDLPFASEEISYTQKVSPHLTKKALYTEKMSDPGLEDLQANFTRAHQAVEADDVSWFLLTPLKTMIGVVSLMRQGVRYALENPGQAMTMGLLLQARTATSTLSLGGLTPLEGFNITGAAEGELFGSSVSSAGDFNGDGLNDVIIGAPYAFPNNVYSAGKSYIIYGTNNKPRSINLSSLTPNQGFTITGASVDDAFGHSVSSAGDFNGDGFNDVIIGAYAANSGVNSQAGKSYVIYGTNSTPSSINLSFLTPLQGFAISGAAASDWSGWSVSSAGDFNGDGLSDVIIGVRQLGYCPGQYGICTGKSYVIYGTNSTPSSIDLSSLIPLQGFSLSGTVTGDDSGWSVSSAGDFNGDGLNDVIVGAYYANNDGSGKSYVIYGTNSTPSSIDLSSLTPLQGVNITGAAAGDWSGYSVSSAGDFTGDGFSDVIIGAPSANSNTGKSYVIYGTNSTPSSIDLSSLTPLQGFTINGAAAGDQFGYSVSSAGDFNGDELNDVIIGAYYANSYRGESYVIYGTNSKPSSISLSSLTSLQGFTITGTAPFGTSGSSVSSAGDFNSDGFSDVIIGAPGGFPKSGAGNSYIIYGMGLNESSASGGSGKTSWKIYAAIGGGVGGAVVAGVAGGVIVKKCCFSKKKNSGYARLNTLEENAEMPTT